MEPRGVEPLTPTMPLWSSLSSIGVVCCPRNYLQEHLENLSMAKVAIDRLLCHLFGHFFSNTHSYAKKAPC